MSESISLLPHRRSELPAPSTVVRAALLAALLGSATLIGQHAVDGAASPDAVPATDWYPNADRASCHLVLANGAMRDVPRDTTFIASDGTQYPCVLAD